jgi:CheY-like chemotaxis protein
MSSTILWVEDDPNDIILVGRALDKLRFPPRVHVRDGEEAVRFLSSLGESAGPTHSPVPALVLLDLKLPRLSGLEVLKWIRLQPGLRRLPVIVFTASTELIDINRAYDLGANAYVIKPVDFNTLLELFQRFQKFWMESNRNPTISPSDKRPRAPEPPAPP